MKKILTKIMDFIKKHNNIFAIILIFLSFFGITINCRITNSDELWNFQNVFKLYNGYKIYQESNVIVTPLFFILGEKIFEILGANFLTFRIYNIIILINFYFITYLILKKIGISKKISIILVLGLILLKGYNIILIQASYNTMALMISFLGVLLYLYRFKYNSIFQGIILFLVFMSKQNIGIFYAIGLILCEILEKQKIRVIAKRILAEILIFFMLDIIFIIYLYNTNNLYNFINYTVLGIGEFAKRNMYIDISNIMIIVFLVVINIVLTLFFIKNKKVICEQKRQLIVLNCFSISFIMIVIPIINDAHFLLGTYLSIILFIYLMFILIKEIDVKINKKIINIILIILILFECSFSIYNFISWYKMITLPSYKFEKSHPFYGGVYDKELIRNIDNVTKYIKENSNKVVILSGKAALYMVPLKQNNGMLDLPFKGNLGAGEEEGLVSLIRSMKETEILIDKDEKNMEWQESKMAREYIIRNMEKIGEIEEFDIYKCK